MSLSPAQLALILGSAFLIVSSTAIAQRGREQPPVVTVLTINGGAETISSTEALVSLVHTIVGTRPSEYRVSHRADFEGASWLGYTDRITMRNWFDPTGPSCDASHPSHRVTLYFQVRSTLGTEVKVIDGQRQVVPARVESNVLKASVCARTP